MHFVQCTLQIPTFTVKYLIFKYIIFNDPKYLRNGINVL